jgi:hypothetical protein
MNVTDVQIVRASPPATRRLTIGDKRYIDTGTGWRVHIAGENGPGTVRLKPGEAAYVEARFAGAAGEQCSDDEHMCSS